ncbi:hypothetical protein ES332_A02G069200v1 [Gossypium tomentosum]|uniref:Uncharacterized protein n=1 Tax=Gossypium tomentosum TaxID=34277 RepID=A0A5D2RF27_GOSTO|nr:hypothetical protein ES332_A02G069200v1 [Gossypium tomentosum]
MEKRESLAFIIDLPLFVFRCRNLHCTNWQRCSSSSLEVIPYNQNHLRRITCSKTKLQSDVFATKTTKDASTPCKNAQSGRRDQGKKRKAVYPDKQGRQFSP